MFSTRSVTENDLFGVVDGNVGCVAYSEVQGGLDGRTGDGGTGDGGTGDGGTAGDGTAGDGTADGGIDG